MPNDLTATGNGPWRLLILDRDEGDPKWILATVTVPGDVQPADLGPGSAFTALPEAGAWVRGLLGRPVSLTPMTRACVWRVDAE